MSMNYTQLQNAILTFAQLTNDANFQTMFPTAIDYAEGRIYSDMNLLAAVVTDSSTVLVASNRNFTLPGNAAGTFKGIQHANIITPAGQTSPDLGARVALLPVTKDFLDFAYPSSNPVGVPNFFAPVTQTNYILGPWPDLAYTLEISGNILPNPMSAANPTTFIGNNLSPLLFAACMIWAAGYKMNYGAQAEDPKMASSWEQTYNNLLTNYKIEEVRKRFQGLSWSTQEPSPIAVAQRAA